MSRHVFGWRILALIVLISLPISLSAQATHQEVKPESVEKSSLGQIRNVHQCGTLYLTGQFNSDDVSKIGEAGVKRVISLRTKGEIKWDEAAALKDAELEFVEVPFRSPDSLTDEVFDKVRELLSDHETPTLFHCGSANRVGSVWLPYRVLDEGVDLETALAEAKKIGLRNPGYEKKALDYIQRKQKENK